MSDRLSVGGPAPPSRPDVISLHMTEVDEGSAPKSGRWTFGFSLWMDGWIVQSI